jgi:hypothetical protein
VAKQFDTAIKCDLPRCEICELAKTKRRPKKYETKSNIWGTQSKSFESRNVCGSGPLLMQATRSNM